MIAHTDNYIGLNEQNEDMLYSCILLCIYFVHTVTVAHLRHMESNLVRPSGLELACTP